MSKLFKRTKILATIGPAVASEESVTDIIFAGVNGCRLNFSHGTYEEHEQEIAWIRSASEKKNRPVAIVADLQGPKIRLGMLKNNHFEVKKDDEIILDASISEHDGSNILPIQYNLAEKVKPGEPIFLFDGKIKAEILNSVSDFAVKIRILNDGILMSRKGLNLPDTDFGGDIFTKKDIDDLTFCMNHDIDYVAMSFIQSADDIEKLRRALAQNNSDIKIIAKIETKKAIESDANLESIVRASDGIMVARGDMAVEAGNEVVPIIQRKLISLCRKHSKFCIIATQMLSSMTENPSPSRAEVSDVATAVLQGADVVMLSDETANGKYPLETVREMKKIILYAQNNYPLGAIKSDPIGDSAQYDALAESASHLAEKLDADVLVSATLTGATSRALAAVRPSLPIISVTENQRVANQLALIYGSVAFVRPYSESRCDELIEELKSRDYLKLREGREKLLTVMLSGGRGPAEITNTIKVINL